MKKQVIVEDFDLVEFAEQELGFDWNVACDVLRPFREFKNCTMYKSDMNPETDDGVYNLGEDCCKIVFGFMDLNGLEEMYYVGHI